MGLRRNYAALKLALMPLTPHPSPFFFPLLVAVSIAVSGCRFSLPFGDTILVQVRGNG